MSKRLIRIKTTDAFLKLEKGTEINAVLQNGRTYFGTMESITTSYIVLLDTRNHSHQIALSELYEIVCDRESITASITS